MSAVNILRQAEKTACLFVDKSSHHEYFGKLTEFIEFITTSTYTSLEVAGQHALLSQIGAVAVDSLLVETWYD